MFHFSHFVKEGTEIVAYVGRKYSNTPIIVFKNANGNFIVTAGNFTDKPVTLSVKIGKKYLNINAQAHSFNTYVM